MAKGRLYHIIDDLPDFTCDDIDAVIMQMEDLRNANSSLREIAEKWQEEAESAWAELVEIEKQVNTLELEVSNLKEEAKANVS